MESKVPTPKSELRIAERIWIDNARKLIDFLESRPDLINSNIYISHHVESKAEAAVKVRLLGTAKKTPYNGILEVRRDFGPHRIEINITREVVCNKVQTGTRTVTKQVARPAVYDEVTVEEPIFEWECNPILGQEPEALPQPVDAETF